MTGYQIYRCSGRAAATHTLAHADHGTTYSDTGLAAGTSYGYEVRAVDAAGNLGALSNAVSATTPAPPTRGAVRAGHAPATADRHDEDRLSAGARRPTTSA